MARPSEENALTIEWAGVQNAGDDRALVDTLRRTLGQRAPRRQLTRLGRMIAQKTDIQYDHRTTTVAEAAEFVEQAAQSARWAERELARPQERFRREAGTMSEDRAPKDEPGRKPARPPAPPPCRLARTRGRRVR